MLDASNPIEFRGIFNEDLQVAIDAGVQGRVAMSTMLVSIQSPVRTTNRGGCTICMRQTALIRRVFIPLWLTQMWRV